MFERTLSALIKGLRSHRGTKDEARYIAAVLDEIRNEVKSGDMQVKTEAVLKLTYLQMLGYPAAQASFHMLEVMASSKYHFKHVGYLAVSQCFTPQTDVLILATNMIKKDLQSPDPFEVAAALNGLSHIINVDLASHLASDIIKLLTHTRPAIRKRALLVLHAVITHFPDALSMAWDRLREKLDDPDPGVLSAAVNIVCELSRRDAKPFVALSPQLFNLLTNSTNNWMLIKLIKLFGILTPHEPRLVRKLLPPIRNIISTTPAMSLLYECIHTVIIGGMLTGPDGEELAQTCIDKLAHFLTNSDQNLKYISLLALVRILPSHPHLLAEHYDTVLASIEDPDLSIRLRALDLLSGMASRDTFQNIVERLMRQLDPESPPVAGTTQRGAAKATKGSSAAAAALRATLGKANTSSSSGPLASASSEGGPGVDPSAIPSYRLQLARRILDLGAEHTYTKVADFEWYLSTLIRLGLLTGFADDVIGSSSNGSSSTGGASAASSSHQLGRTTASQIIDITARVRGTRQFAARKMTQLLKDRTLTASGNAQSAQLVRAAAWVVGEYCAETFDPRSTATILLNSVFEDDTSIVGVVPVDALAAVVHNGVKVFAHWAASISESWDARDAEGRRRALEEVKTTSDGVVKALVVYATSRSCEVRERATEFLQMFRLLQRDVEASLAKSHESQPSATEGEERKPLAPTAADLVAAPRSLHLLSPLFFGHALGPVADKAQSKVPQPPGIDLYAWIVEPGAYTVVGEDKGVELEDEDDGLDSGSSTPTLLGSRLSKMSQSESSRSRTGTPVGRRPPPVDLNLLDSELDNIPIVQLTMDDLGGSASAPSASTAAALVPLHSSSSSSAPLTRALAPTVFEEEELPEGAAVVQAKKVVRKKSAATGTSASSAGAGSLEGSEATGPGAAKKKKKRREVEIA